MNVTISEALVKAITVQHDPVQILTIDYKEVPNVKYQTELSDLQVNVVFPFVPFHVFCLSFIE